MPLQPVRLEYCPPDGPQLGGDATSRNLIITSAAYENQSDYASSVHQNQYCPQMGAAATRHSPHEAPLPNKRQA